MALSCHWPKQWAINRRLRSKCDKKAKMRLDTNTSNRRAIYTMTTKVSQELYEDVYKLWTEVCKTLPAGCILHYTIQPFGKAGVQAGKDRGGNIMGHESISQCCKFIVPNHNQTHHL